jgi:endonuclease/exonuclease/phosphatase (EEP) superfamily protein YafD
MSAICETARYAVVTLGLLTAAGTLASLSRHPHWAIRGWDFPRVQIIFVAALCLILYVVIFFDGRWTDWLFAGCMTATAGWQGLWIFPYTIFTPVQVKSGDGMDAAAELRIIISNVWQHNRNFERWMEMIRRERPDLILALETDRKWADALDQLAGRYPYRVSQVQNNEYGMMLFSRLRLENTSVRFLVEEDIPSIHADVMLENGTALRFHGIHPRPPEPIRNINASARNAELVVIGKEIRNEKGPVVVAGDLNDVAWSRTTELFLKISGLLDPRIGRGFFSTFPADWPFLRWPLDHLFHSDDFQLNELRVLERVGSDHLPVLVHLTYEPWDSWKQPEPDADNREEKIAQTMVDRKLEEKNGQGNAELDKKQRLRE